MLCDYTSIFPVQLATYWRSKGINSVFVTSQAEAPDALPDGTRIVRSCDYETRLTRTVARRLMSPILYRLENSVPRFKQRFTRITGMSADTQYWMPHFVTFFTNAWPAARAALAQRPRFVFGHEVTSYGLATALCRGVPRIMFPWGGDIFTYAETSPYHYGLTKLALHGVDLILPSSTTAARHICQRFGISPRKVCAISWGVDRQKFKRADAGRRFDICARWRINPDAKVFLNPRRFSPDWGASVALKAFMQLASETTLTHFILFGGAGTEEFTRQARAQVEAQLLSSRFTLLEGFAPSADCVELMSISDVFVSLLGRVDMRSASVLQAVAAGATPVVGEHSEYREMESLGFAALFVQPDSVADVLKALRFCLQNPEKTHEMTTRNDRYLTEHEDYSTQMDKLLSLIYEFCDRYDDSISLRR
jgi:glycosyltransferase involved in cell wall biosynthesis